MHNNIKASNAKTKFILLNNICRSTYRVSVNGRNIIRVTERGTIALLDA